MRLLTRLGFDTGFSRAADGFNPSIRAGCEKKWSPRTVEWFDTAPRILKTPYWCRDLRHAVKMGVPIAHVFIPVRPLSEVATSRIKAHLACSPGKTAVAEEKLMAEWLGWIVETVVTNGIDFTLMRYPRHVHDWEYCGAMLVRGLPDIQKLPAGRFQTVHKELSKLRQ